MSPQLAEGWQEVSGFGKDLREYETKMRVCMDVKLREEINRLIEIGSGKKIIRTSRSEERRVGKECM